MVVQHKLAQGFASRLVLKLECHARFCSRCCAPLGSNLNLALHQASVHHLLDPLFHDFWTHCLDNLVGFPVRIKLRWVVLEKYLLGYFPQAIQVF